MRVLPLAALLCACLACGSPALRSEYAPVGRVVGDSLTPWTVEGERAAFSLRCQGRYVNEVAGRRVATLHFQLLATRTAGDPLQLPLEDMLLTAAPGDPSRELRPAEAWHGQQPVERVLEVEGWSRSAVDLFFDEVDDDGPAPQVLRLRFVALDETGRQHHEAQFFLLADDDPRRSDAHVVDDSSFGYRDGHYFPGLGDLGPRRLQSTAEARLFYVFHDP